jgi:CheY-like chemotaxis protein
MRFDYEPAIRVVAVTNEQYDADLFEEVASSLKGTISLTVCRSTQDAASAIPQRALPQLILLASGSTPDLQLQFVKSHKPLRSVPVVVLATSAEAEDVQSWYGDGAACVVQRPSERLADMNALETCLVFWTRSALLPYRDQLGY